MFASALPVSTRCCTPCTVCCVRLPVPAGLLGHGAKPAGVRCPRLGRTGCRNYLCRPSVCSQFRCAWLADASWPVAWRPDLSGLLCLREELTEGLLAALVYETRPAALETPKALDIVNALCQTTSVVTIVDCQGHGQRLPGGAARSNYGVGDVAAA